MELEKLFLKKEELPILHESCFHIPIHPKLLDENLKIDDEIAKRIFPEVANEWYEELKEYVKKENSSNREQIQEVYLNEKPTITKEFNRQYLMGYWEDEIQCADNGFVTNFSINRNAGGSLDFDKDNINCETAIPGYYIKFLKEKAKEFEFENFGTHSSCLIYASHNIDHFPGALFLRNWAIKYMNEVFKQIF